MKYLFVALISLVMSCSKPNPEELFFNHLKSLHGQTFTGRVISPLKENDPFVGKELSFTVASSSDTEIRIPFLVGEDKSRTWIFTKTEKGLLFKHDHRHDDGTPDEITNYGGFANPELSSQWSQSFPADEFTAKLIPAAATNEWTVKLDFDQNELHYMLKRDQKLRFHASFDLSNKK